MLLKTEKQKIRQQNKNESQQSMQGSWIARLFGDKILSDNLENFCFGGGTKDGKLCV